MYVKKRKGWIVTLREQAGAGVVVLVTPALGEKEKGRPGAQDQHWLCGPRSGWIPWDPISTKQNKREGTREQRRALERGIRTANHLNQ